LKYPIAAESDLWEFLLGREGRHRVRRKADAGEGNDRYSLVKNYFASKGEKQEIEISHC